MRWKLVAAAAVALIAALTVAMSEPGCYFIVKPGDTSYVCRR